jgi:NAD(P)-dependent dehydrogenase (short-subunit alcohol dehydrogenase family)
MHAPNPYPLEMRFVVTGANRGIGLELTRQLLARGDAVEAGVREPDRASELSQLGKSPRGASQLRVHAVDVARDDSVRAFARAIGDRSVDVLINNAGVLGKMQGLEELDLEDMVHTFRVDALGAIAVTRALLPALRKGDTRKLVHISTGMASIADNTSGGAYGYRMAKAALNIASKSIAVNLRGERFISVVMNPGWVQTEMGGAGAPTPVRDSAAGILATIDKLGLDQSGSFLDYRGGTLAW